jgi:hypothetical protein
MTRHDLPGAPVRGRRPRRIRSGAPIYAALAPFADAPAAALAAST